MSGIISHLDVPTAKSGRRSSARTPIVRSRRASGRSPSFGESQRSWSLGSVDTERSTARLSSRGKTHSLGSPDDIPSRTESANSTDFLSEDEDAGTSRSISVAPRRGSAGSIRASGGSARSTSNDKIHWVEDEQEDVDFTRAEQALMDKCKLPDSAHRRKLFKILEQLRGEAGSPEDLVSMFAERCYRDLVDRPHVMAKKFAKLAFGDNEALYHQGPEQAWAAAVKRQAEKLQAEKRSSGRSTGERRSSAERRGSKTKFTMSFADGKYLVGDRIGKGGTADVRLARDTTTNETVAMKIFKAKHAVAGAEEGRILKMLAHPGVLKVRDVFTNATWVDGQRTTVIVLEFAKYGSLIDFVMKCGTLEPRLARWVFKQIFSAVKHCHKSKIIHRDIKPDNTLLVEDANGDARIKLCDFGGALDTTQVGMKNRLLGTERYAAPEVLAKTGISPKVDVFALGVMIFVSLSGTHPFKRADGEDVWFKYIARGRWDKFWAVHRMYTPEFPKDVMDLIEGMLAPNPEERFTIDDVLQHGWTRNRDVCSDSEASDLLKARFANI